MKKALSKILAIVALCLALSLTLASCEMLPPEVQDAINSIIGATPDPEPEPDPDDDSWTKDY